MNSTIPAQNEDLAHTLIDGSAVIVDSRNAQLYWLNKVASRIWQLADGSRSLEAIAARLCEEFEVDTHRARDDVEQMVRAFADKGMFILAGSQTPNQNPHQTNA